MSDFEKRITRRQVLSRGVQAAALAATAAQIAPLLAAPAARWFKIGACEWNLGKADPSSLEVAKEIGLDGIQVDMGSPAADLPLRKPEVQKAYLQAARKTGMGIGSIAIGALNSVPLKSDPRAAQWLLDSLDACKAMGLSIVMPACFGNGDLDMAKTAEIDHLVDVLKQSAAKAEKLGVTIGLESYLSAEDNLRIIERVGSAAVKVYYDVGNSTDKGRDVTKEIPVLGHQICEFHFKDDGYMLGQGRIDFRKVRKAIDKIGYSGWIQIEAAAPHGLMRDYPVYYKFLRGIYPERG
jgi:sugar phosphate isomerase/epimerase